MTTTLSSTTLNNNTLTATTSIIGANSLDVNTVTNSSYITTTYGNIVFSIDGVEYLVTDIIRSSTMCPVQPSKFPYNDSRIDKAYADHAVAVEKLKAAIPEFAEVLRAVEACKSIEQQVIAEHKTLEILKREYYSG